jgi:DNA processing protein
MVGSRKGSHLGRTFTRQLSGDLAALGFTIVSGLARGIDTAAHEGALAAGGRTLAVLGCGIDRLYPPEHGSLRQRIEHQGAVLSEFPLGTAPHSYHFPQRNRVISGLSLGVIVAEATSRSGSLITARMALEQNREVFAVPGNVTSTLARGPHRLIKAGAKLVENPLDIVEEILPMLEPSFRSHIEKQPLEPQSQLPTPSLGPEEQCLFECISLDPVSLDDLISQSSYAASEVMSILLSLEIKGLIKQIPGLQYLRMSIR